MPEKTQETMKNVAAVKLRVDGKRSFRFYQNP
jgi:hypothetical protein